MSSPKHFILKTLDLFDKPFEDQLDSILSWKEYQECVPALDKDDLVWLINYLDKVCLHVAFPTLRLSQSRHSLALIFPVLLLRSVDGNLEVFVATGRCSQNRMSFRPT